MPDVKRLIAEVAARNGIRIDPDDPAFCLVTLNQLTLEEAGLKVAEEIRAATSDFQDAVRKIEGRTGVIFAQELKDALALVESQFESRANFAVKERSTKPIASRTGGRAWALTWLAVGLLSSALIFGCGVLLGIALH